MDDGKIELSERDYNRKEAAFAALILGEAEYVKRAQENEKNDRYAKVPSTVETLKEAYLFTITEWRHGKPLPQHFNPDLLSVPIPKIPSQN